MAAKFFREGRIPDILGFDDRASPPWTMLPAKAKRNVTLADGAGLNVKLRTAGDAAFVGVRELPRSAGGRVFELEGLAPKTALLDAVDAGGATRATVEITVKNLVRLATFFGFVFDRSGRVTPMGYDQAMQDIGLANKIMQPQINVEMFRSDSGGVKLPFDLPTGFPVDGDSFRIPPVWRRGGPGMLPCISSQPLGPSGCVMETSVIAPLTQADFDALVDYQKLYALMLKVDPSFDYNIFYVAGFSSRGGLGASTGAYTPKSAKHVAVNVWVMPRGAAGHELAHELGHYLMRSSPLKGVGEHSTDRRDLMTSVPTIDSVWIPRDQANVMNSSGFP